MSKKINCLKMKEDVQKKSLLKLKKALNAKKIDELSIDDPKLSDWLERIKAKKQKKAARFKLGLSRKSTSKSLATLEAFLKLSKRH